MLPAVLAQRLSGDFNNIVGDINLACAEARKLHPNCLYFSHADGTQEESDLSSSNLYFNFTPLQEREEWLSSWAQNGIRPWYASEFGAPYYACWFHSRVPQMTEWLAVYYGDRAYDEEQVDLLRRLKPFAKDCQRLTHGGWVDGKDLYGFSPLAEEYSRMLVYRTNRAWRGFGQNGGLMYLTSWNWDEANAMRERQRLANGPLVTWLGGAPQFTDRTHAYHAGAAIEKQLVFIWDGFGDKTAKAAWRFVEAASGRLVASGRAGVALKQGDIKFEKISVPAPEVKVRTGYRFEVAFEAPGIDDSVKSDAFEVEVHPSTPPTIAASAAKVALYDPEGDSAKVLDSLGVKYATVDGLLAAATNTSFTHLVLGRHALDHAAGLEKYAARVAEGLRILVLQQTAETWQALGFKPEDSMARAMYNVALDGVDNRDLNHWAGSPMGPGAGHTMKHSARRGPRWTHTHAVSSTPFEIPNRAGFTPIVRGEFDNAYTALLEARRGKGSATFCAFDFEGRVGAGGCPAATAVAKATFDRFLGGQAPAARQAHVAGARAKRLAAALGLDAAEYAGGKLENAVLLAGRDSPLDGPALKNALGRNATAVVFGTTNIVAAIGLALDGQAPTNVWRIANRQELGAFAPFAGVGPSLLRWRDEQPVWTLKGGRGWKTACDGVFALAGDGSVLVDMTDPFVLCDRYRDDAGGKVANQAAVGGWGVSPPGEKDLYLRSAAQSEENDLRRWAIVLANLGVGSGEKAFARSLYAKPLVGKGSLGAALADGTSKAISPAGSFNMLGPWPCALDNPEKTLDSIFPVEAGVAGDSGETAEKMAIQGDIQPNPRFRPIGCEWNAALPSDLRFIDWRPAWSSHPSGMLSLDWMPSPAHYSGACAWYAVGYLPRTKDGTVSLRFETKTAGKVWINGVEACRSIGGKVAVAEGVKVYAEGHQGDGVFEGRNVIAVKVVSDAGSKNFRLQVSHEPSAQDEIRDRVSALDGVELLETANPYFDPYEYIYW